MYLLSEGHSGKPVASCCCRLVAIASAGMAWSHAHNPLVGTDRKNRRTYRRRRRFSVRLGRPLSLPTAIIAISIANVAAVARECGRLRRRKERERRKEACDSRPLSAPWRRSHECERYIFSSSPAHLSAAGRSPFILQSPLPLPVHLRRRYHPDACLRPPTSALNVIGTSFTTGTSLSVTRRCCILPEPSIALLHQRSDLCDIPVANPRQGSHGPSARRA
jgi:hypothetical protein